MASDERIKSCKASASEKILNGCKFPSLGQKETGKSWAVILVNQGKTGSGGILVNAEGLGNYSQWEGNAEREQRGTQDKPGQVGNLGQSSPTLQSDSHPHPSHSCVWQELGEMMIIWSTEGLWSSLKHWQGL